MVRSGVFGNLWKRRTSVFQGPGAGAESRHEMGRPNNTPHRYPDREFGACQEVFKSTSRGRVTTIRWYTCDYLPCRRLSNIEKEHNTSTTQNNRNHQKTKAQHQKTNNLGGHALMIDDMY